MPRLPRIDIPDAFYHVMARGIERRAIFLTDGDRRDFVERLSMVVQASQARVYAWALMTNHFHLFLRRGGAPLSTLMRRLMTGYAITFNRSHQRVGHLFANRYKAILCEKEPYFLELIRYVHLNPLRAGLVKDLEELGSYPWSGHAALVGARPASFEAVGEVLENFGPQPHGARRELLAFMAGGVDDVLVKDFEAKLFSAQSAEKDLPVSVKTNDKRILGGQEFAMKASQSLPREAALADDGYGQDVGIDKILKAVCESCLVNQRVLLSSSRERQVSRARSLLCFAARECGNLSNAELQRLLHLSSGAISQLYAKGRNMGEKALLFCRNLKYLNN